MQGGGPRYPYWTLDAGRASGWGPLGLTVRLAAVRAAKDSRPLARASDKSVDGAALQPAPPVHDTARRSLAALTTTTTLLEPIVALITLEAACGICPLLLQKQSFIL